MEACLGRLHALAIGLTPYRSMTEVTPTELLSQDRSLRLPPGLGAPVMMPDVVNLLFFPGRLQVLLHCIGRAKFEIHV